MRWLDAPSASVDAAAAASARARQEILTKPAGALGRLETLAVELAGLCGGAPSVDPVHVAVFAADHGVASRGVSAYPQAVTAQMLANFSGGGAAVAVLARALGASLEVVDVGVISPPPSAGAIDARVAAGTRDLVEAPAMSAGELDRALAAGRASAERALAARARLYVGGEMGIGNTTSATALAAALTGLPPARLAGPGTGLDADGVARKTGLIERALARSRGCTSAAETLRELGGFELAALTGAYVACAQRGLPVLVDGFIASVCALAAVRASPGTRPWLLFAHCSAEPGHRAVLESLAALPLLDLGLRLGEASGAALAVPLLRLACALHNEMATFAEAGVSAGEPS